MNIFKNDIKYILKYSIFVFLVFGLCLFIYSTSLTYRYTIEGLTPTQIDDVKKNDAVQLKEIMDFKSSWCTNTSGTNQDNSCQKMAKNDCIEMPCCIWAKRKDSEKCIAGGKTGALFGEAPEEYYYKGECYKNDGSPC